MTAPSDVWADILRSKPPHLYRYHGLGGQRRDWARDLIVNTLLHFAQPSSFNDPFDCRLPLDFRASRLEVENYWRMVANRAASNGNASPPTKKEKRRKIRRLVHDSTAREQPRLQESVWESVNKSGVACLSADPLNTLMWSYYADGHRGIAVRFNIEDRRLALLSQCGQYLLIPIQYQDQLPNLNFYKSDSHQRIKTLLGTKATAWRHEQEWRIVLVDTTGVVAVPYQLVDGVVLGLRTSREDEQEIRAWLGKRSTQTTLQRVQQKQASFELLLQPA